MTRYAARQSVFTLAALGLVAVAIAGCSTRFPYGTSWDRHNFLSTPHQPVTLTLVDTVTGDELWKLNVPVNKMAVVDLEHKDDWTPGQTPAMPAHQIKWGVMDPGEALGSLPHTQQLNGNPVKLKMTLRPKESAAKPAAE